MNWPSPPPEGEGKHELTLSPPGERERRVWFYDTPLAEGSRPG